MTQRCKLYIDPDDGTWFVLVFKWILELLCVFEDPSIDFDIRHHGQAGHAVLLVMTLERFCRDREAVDQARTTPQLATCLALSEVNPTAFRRRASADLPCLLACEDEVEPFLLHDECFFCRTPEATALTSILLDLTLLLVACPYLPFQTCQLRILLKALSAELPEEKWQSLCNEACDIC